MKDRTIDFFTVFAGEEGRINEGLSSRGLCVDNVVSISYNPVKGYVVWYWKNESKSEKKGKKQ